MKYVNKKTGCVIEIPVQVSGGGWVPLPEKPAKTDAPKERRKRKPKE